MSQNPSTKSNGISPALPNWEESLEQMKAGEKAIAALLNTDSNGHDWVDSIEIEIQAQLKLIEPYLSILQNLPEANNIRQEATQIFGRAMAILSNVDNKHRARWATNVERELYV
jgi:hypothetical protein